MCRRSRVWASSRISPPVFMIRVMWPLGRAASPRLASPRFASLPPSLPSPTSYRLKMFGIRSLLWHVWGRLGLGLAVCRFCGCTGGEDVVVEGVRGGNGRLLVGRPSKDDGHRWRQHDVHRCSGETKGMVCVCVRARACLFIFTSALTSKTFVAARDHKALSTLDAAGETKHSAVRYAPYDAELGPKGSCVSLACTRRRREKSSFGRSNRRQAPRARRRKVCRRRVKNGTERSPSPSTRGFRLLWTNDLS